MIGYERYCQIKQAAAAGRNASQIARELGLHRQTVSTWLGRECYSSDYIVNLLEQRARRLPEPGPLHLTRAAEALELELPAPDLTPYTHDQRSLL